MDTLQVTTTKKREIVDITEQVATTAHGKDGIVTVFVQHTTAAVAVMDLDPGTDQDFLDFLKAITPQLQWRHPHDPAHVPDHLLASVIGPSVTVPIADGALQLGSWQRIVLVELDGPRERQMIVA